MKLLLLLRLNNLKEALPVALLKKKLNLEKTEENNKEEEAHIKKLIKIKNAKEYHWVGLAKQEMLTGKIEEEKKDAKIVQGRSYVIAVSPSMKMSSKSVKQKLLFTNPNIFKK